jgi:hypothetical protein
MDPVQGSMGMLLDDRPWHMPTTEKPVLDTTEIWYFNTLLSRLNVKADGVIMLVMQRSISRI